MTTKTRDGRRKAKKEVPGGNQTGGKQPGGGQTGGGQIGGGGGGQIGGGQKVDACVSERRMTARLKKANAQENEPVSLILENGEVAVLTSGGVIGKLTGREAKDAASCLKKGFLLIGRILTRTGNSATISIHGVLENGH